jgi:hypothetical protein
MQSAAAAAVASTCTALTVMRMGTRATLFV